MIGWEGGALSPEAARSDPGSVTGGTQVIFFPYPRKNECPAMSKLVGGSPRGLHANPGPKLTPSVHRRESIANSGSQPTCPVGARVSLSLTQRKETLLIFL